MSAGNVTRQERYGIINSRSSIRPFMVVDSADPCGYGVEADRFGSRRVAEYFARQLNAGMARVDSHAIVGCKVVAS